MLFSYLVMAKIFIKFLSTYNSLMRSRNLEFNYRVLPFTCEPFFHYLYTHTLIKQFKPRKKMLVAKIYGKVALFQVHILLHC